MILTKEDIGKTVLIRNGDTFVLDAWNDNSMFVISSGPFSWTATGYYLHNVSEHPLNVVKVYETGSSIGDPEDVRVACGPNDHTWVGSGFAGGSVWCSRCDDDYEETLHGNSGL